MGVRGIDLIEDGQCDGETLLIGALRRAAIGPEACALTRRDFAIAFPGDADEVLVMFRAFLAALAHAGRRKLRIGLPGLPAAVPDETSLIALLAAAQAGDDALFDAHLCWLTRLKARRSAAITARALAVALAVHGQWLRPPIHRHCEEPRRMYSEPADIPSLSAPGGGEAR